MIWRAVFFGCAALAAFILAGDNYRAWRHGYVLLGRHRARKLYRDDNPRLFWVNVWANAVMLVLALIAMPAFALGWI